MFGRLSPYESIIVGTAGCMWKLICYGASPMLQDKDVTAGGVKCTLKLGSLTVMKLMGPTKISPACWGRQPVSLICLCPFS